MVVRKSYTTNNNKLTNSPTNLLKMNSSKVFATTMLNGLNDAIRETLSDVLSRMKDAGNASDCREIVEKMLSDVKTNKKVDKVKKPRYSGYHIYMREHRVVVKTEQPELTPQQLTSVVAKSWKDVSEEKKAEFNNRAAKMKADASSSESDSDSSQSDSEKAEKPKKVEKAPKAEKPKKVEKPKKAEKPKKTEKSKKKTKDTQVEDIEVELVSENESDIDI
jgi:cell division septation protein DedD